jgi:hypothetical protein
LYIGGSLKLKMEKFFSFLGFFVLLVSVPSCNSIISSPTGKSYTLKELNDLPAYVIRNMLDFEDPHNLSDENLSDLLSAPIKSPQIYSKILTRLNGPVYPLMVAPRFSPNDIRNLIKHENDTLGPLFAKIQPDYNNYYEKSNQIDTEFKSQYIKYLISTLNLGSLVGDQNYFDINAFLVIFKLFDFAPSFEYEGKKYLLKLASIFPLNNHLLYSPYLNALKIIKSRADQKDLHSFGIIEDSFSVFTMISPLIAKIDLNIVDEGEKFLKALPTMEQLLNHIRRNFPVLISSTTPGHVNGILIFKCLYVFDRSRGSPVTAYVIDQTKITAKILWQLHHSSSLEERDIVIESIRDNNYPPIHPRVTGYQFGDSCTNETLKDLFWGLFNLLKLKPLYKDLMIEVRKIVWNDMLKKYHEFKNDPKKHDIARIIKILLLSAHLQMNSTLNNDFPLPIEIIDEKTLLECWCSFFYSFIKSSPRSYPSAKDNRPLYNMETKKEDSTIGDVVKEKLKSWEKVKTNADEYLKKFVLTQTYTNPVQRLLGNIFIQQGVDCSEIIKDLSEKDINLIRKYYKKFPDFSLLDALSLSMERNPESSITSTDFTSLWELQYGKDWKESVHGHFGMRPEMNFRIKDAPSAKSILFRLLWLQRSVMYFWDSGYTFDTYWDLIRQITREMIDEIPQLAHAFQISEEFDLKSRPMFSQSCGIYSEHRRDMSLGKMIFLMK